MSTTKPSSPSSSSANGAGRKSKKAPSFDASAFADTIARIEALAEKAGVRLAAGASEAELTEAEESLSVHFPDEVRAFYLAHDGGPKGALVCNGRELLSLTGIVQAWEAWKEQLDDEELDDDDDAEPDEGVRQAWWHPAWIPFTDDHSGNHDMIDLAPDEGGELGQIIAVWHDDTSRTLDSGDLLSWMLEQSWGEEES